MNTYRVRAEGDSGAVTVEDVQADAYEIEKGGVLLFGDRQGFLVKGYAPGTWLTVEPVK